MHLAPADAVGHDAARDREQRERDPAGGEHDAEVGRAAQRASAERDRHG